jgi:hypothetical protein
MRSKVQFDLNGLNEAVITAKISSTEDVRDKVANRFNQEFGYDSILATVYHIDCSSFKDEDGQERLIKTIEIKPVGSVLGESQRLASLMCDFQLDSLFSAIKREIEFRKRTNKGNVSYKCELVAAEEVRDYSVEDNLG